MIYENLKKEFNIYYYHGDDLKTEEVEGEILYHREIKKSHFQDVAKHWSKSDMLLYTGTLVAGVDFSMSHFDKAIHVFCPRGTAANYFV